MRGRDFNNRIGRVADIREELERERKNWEIIAVTITDDLTRKAILTLTFVALLLLAHYQRGEIAKLEARRSELEATLEAERRATAAADAETRKLTAKVAELRRKAIKKEDQLNATIKQNAQDDPCLERRVDAAIIEQLQLRGSVAGSSDTGSTD